MSTGKNVRSDSAPKKAWQLFARPGTSRAAGRRWQRQTLGQLPVLAAATLGLILAAAVADCARGPIARPHWRSSLA